MLSHGGPAVLAFVAGPGGCRLLVVISLEPLRTWFQVNLYFKAWVTAHLHAQALIGHNAIAGIGDPDRTSADRNRRAVHPHRNRAAGRDRRVVDDMPVG